MQINDFIKAVSEKHAKIFHAAQLRDFETYVELGRISIALSFSSAALPITRRSDLQSFAGNWTCALESAGATYLSSSANSVWGNWIKEEITFPAQVRQPASVGNAYQGREGLWPGGQKKKAPDLCRRPLNR